MGDKANPHKVEIEAHGEDIPRVREFLRGVELGSHLTRFRVEIESDKPILTIQNTDEDTAETPEKEPEQEPTQNGDGSQVETPDEDSQQTDKHTIEKYEEGQTLVLSHRSKDTNGLDIFNTSTNAWKLASFLYRQNEPLKLGHIHAYLEDTPLEIKYKSISATLSSMRDDGLVENKNPDKGPSKYTLSEKGEKKVAKTVDKADTYILRLADKVAGLHPTDNFGPPDFRD